MQGQTTGGAPSRIWRIVSPGRWFPLVYLDEGTGEATARKEPQMRRTIALFMAAALAAALLAVPTAASAKAEVTEYTGTETGPDMTVFLSYRQSGPITHYSHVAYFSDETTDWRTTGATTVVMNFKGIDLALPTMAGHIWGTFHTDIESEHGVGAWDGTWTGKMVEGVPVFKAVGHGSGDLDGLKLKANYEGTPLGIIAIEGRILDPHGG